MILPTKHLSEDRALITIGSQIIPLLAKPRTIHSLWDATKAQWRMNGQPISYDWFILSLDMIYAFGAIDISEGLIRRVKT